MTNQTLDLEALKFPVGHFSFDEKAAATPPEQFIDEIEAFPAQLISTVLPLVEAQLDTPYRPGGWTVRQLVHHIADSHLNAYIRCKLILTEEKPPLKPYDQDAWATLADSHLPIEFSLNLIEALHQRWVTVLRAVKGEEWNRGGFHMEHQRELSLHHIAAMYAWHSRHHLAHIQNLIEREWTN